MACMSQLQGDMLIRRSIQSFGNPSRLARSGEERGPCPAMGCEGRNIQPKWQHYAESGVIAIVGDLESGQGEREGCSSLGR
jgi:hypothetical protein